MHHVVAAGHTRAQAPRACGKRGGHCAWAQKGQGTRTTSPFPGCLKQTPPAREGAGLGASVQILTLCLSRRC